MDGDKLRRVILRPYRRGLGLPYFVLETYATNGRDWRGCTTIGYRLTQWQDGKGIVPLSYPFTFQPIFFCGDCAV